MSLASLKQVFEQDRRGIISLRELYKHSRSHILISQVAASYYYFPLYTKDSHKINYYAHITYNPDEF